MPKFEFCLPTMGKAVPAGPEWFHEIKYDGYRLRIERDGEAVILGLDGIADFGALHSRKHNEEVQFCAFDVLAIDGDDVRGLPLSMRKANLDRLLRGRPDGIFINPFEMGAIGPDLFKAACEMGLEGLVSKRGDRPYRGGKSPYWIKVKNRTHPAMVRVKETFERQMQ
jgi:bifunctional non-homologous end joining protein LigD